MKRYIAVLLALVCLLTPLANTKGVFAVTYSTAEYEDIISTLMGEASTFEENFNNVQEQQGIYTQLYQARQIFGYATCVYGAAYSAQKDDAYRKQIGGSLGMLAVTLSDMIVSYNASYFVSEGEYKGEAFSQCSGETSVLKNLEAASDDAIQKACEVLEEWCIAVAKTYLVQTVEKYADDVELDNEDMQEENSSLCSEIYKALKYGLTCISDVESVLGQQNEQTLSLKGYTFKKSTVEERIKADIEKYAELFGTGLINVAIDDESDNIISIDPDKSILENMADVQVDDDGVISIEEYPQLSLAYFGILARIAPTFSDDGSVSDVKSYDMSYYTDEILDGVYSHTADQTAGEVDGEYHMTKGDYITVTVKNRNYTLATKLKNKIYGTPFPKTSVYVTYGGRIQDENY